MRTAYMEWVPTVSPFPLHGGFMTRPFGEYPREENGIAYLPILTGSQHQRFCLTLNCSEKPREPNPTKLSEILEENVDEKYNLSARACQGILTRAEKKGKDLPKALKYALERQCSCSE